MYDQAAQLRRLMQQAGLSFPATNSPGKRKLLVVFGGRPGCGATSVALHLGLALVQQGQRTVLVDADETGIDVAHRCGLAGKSGLAAALAGECTIHEAIERGPGGLQVIAGVGGAVGRREWSEAGPPRLSPLLRALDSHTDWTVIDAGRGMAPLSAPLWREATAMVVVTTPDAPAIMETYTSLKSNWEPEHSACVPQIFVNFAESDAIAADVHRRLNESCRKFLGCGVDFAGSAPEDALLKQAA